MIDLTKITPEQANRIECALLCLNKDVKDFIKCYDELAHDESFPESARKTMASNREWWKAVYELIYEDTDWD